MISMSEADDQPVGQVTKELHKAYRDSLVARKRWVGVNSRVYDEDLRDELHADLHETTMGWFEALLPYLASNDAVEEEWEDVRLWKKGVVHEPRLVCQSCETVYNPKDVESVVCPNCESEFQRRDLPVTDENGTPVYEWVTGLQTLTEWCDRTEVVQKKMGKFKPKTKTEVRPLRLSPDNLLRIARLLDKCADDLGLLATVSSSTPRTELTDEMIEEVEEWRQENLE